MLLAIQPHQYTVYRHPKIIAKTQISRPRPPRDPGRGPVMPTGCAHRVIVSAFGDSRAAGRTGRAASRPPGSHERGGRHTCDKRRGLAAIRAAHPNIDYSLVTAEEDPLWGDGVTREPWPDLGKRAAAFIEWLMAHEEEHIAVAAHSAARRCLGRRRRRRPTRAASGPCRGSRGRRPRPTSWRRPRPSAAPS